MELLETEIEDRLSNDTEEYRRLSDRHREYEMQLEHIATRNAEDDGALLALAVLLAPFLFLERSHFGLSLGRRHELAREEDREDQRADEDPKDPRSTVITRPIGRF